MKRTAKKTDKVFFIRSLPEKYADRLRKYATERRMTLAGAVMDLVEHGETTNFFK
jgi:hypothetical protein